MPKLIERLQKELVELQNIIEFLVRHPIIEELEIIEKPYLCGGYLDFDGLTHKQRVALMLHFGGQWKRENNTGTVTYTRKEEYGGFKIRFYGAQPPPSCTLVYEEVLVPEKVQVIPEHKEKRIVGMKCTKDETEAQVDEDTGIQPINEEGSQSNEQANT